MTKHDLKELAAIGAELGAAKAENERLRELLRDVEFRGALTGWEPGLIGQIAAALSQQAEPVCPFCGEPSDHCNQSFPHPSKPAPAQDELPAGGVTIEKDIFGTVHIKMGDFDYIQIQYQYPYTDNASQNVLAKRIVAALTRPAQTEQQPTAVPEGWLIELGFDVLDRPFRFVDSKSHTPTIKVILPACEPDDSSSWDLRDEIARRIGSVLAAPIAQTAPQGKFRMGDLVKKSTGSEWVGRVVGWYSTEQTKEGYAVESSAHRNSVQIYPVTALEAVE